MTSPFMQRNSLLALQTDRRWPAGYEYRYVLQVGSTMDEARAIAPHLSAPTWIHAGAQTQGRGRRARAWRDPSGNLATTLVMPVQDVATEQVSLASFIAALAVYDMAHEMIRSEQSMTLKWPNDVLINGGKVSGILLEGHHPKSGPVVSIGIGVNLVAAPQSNTLEQGAVAPVALGQFMPAAPDPNIVMGSLADHFARYWAIFRTEGFAPIRAAWMAHAAHLGCDITARLPKETHVGRFDGIDTDGCLLLSTRHGPLRIAAADIYF